MNFSPRDTGINLGKRGPGNGVAVPFIPDHQSKSLAAGPCKIRLTCADKSTNALSAAVPSAFGFGPAFFPGLFKSQPVLLGFCGEPRDKSEKKKNRNLQTSGNIFFRSHDARCEPHIQASHPISVRVKYLQAVPVLNRLLPPGQAPSSRVLFTCFCPFFQTQSHE